PSIRRCGRHVPYEEISYIRLERVVRIGELKAMYGETGYVDSEDRLSAPGKEESPAGTPAVLDTAPQNGSAVPVGVSGTDPASIAKQNLLNRIRAARANIAGTTGKLGGGNK
ncbi:MAG TPA: hypothetical protein VLM40_18890, partial [Gemmata sp.]|nr:hypothetical protein [Gemmata sp.]